MLEMKLTGGLEFAEKLKTKGVSIIAVLMVKLTQAMTQLQGRIVSEKLSGLILHRRSGAMARGIVAFPAQLQGEQIRAGVGATLTPAFYTAFFEEQEVGGTGGIGHMWAVNAVKGRALAFMIGGRQVFAKAIFHPPLAARPFLRHSAMEDLDDIQQQLQTALDEELQK